MKRKRFHSLDGPRGVCALSVMLFHAADMFRPGPLLAHGFLEVDMFFLLSGFVIALNYEQALQSGLRVARMYKGGMLARLPVISTEVLLALWLCIAVVPTLTATPTFDAIAVILLCPLLVMLLIRSDAAAPAFTRGLGALSYPLYVVHPGIKLPARRTPLFGLDRAPDLLRATLVIGLCLAAAWVVLWISNLHRPWLRAAAAPAAWAWPRQ